MKKVKINLLAIIGLMVAVGTVAFTAPKENLATTYWFEVEPGDVIGDFINDEPMEPCSGSTTLCAVGLEEHQVDLGDGTSDPVPSISDVDEAKEQSYGQRNP